jgi:ubiquinone biosynthesis protein UbiJ
MNGILGRVLRHIALQWQRREVSAVRRALSEVAEEARAAEAQAEESARLAEVDAMRVRVSRGMESHYAARLREAEADLAEMRRDL